MKFFLLLLALTFCKLGVDNKELPQKLKYEGTEPAFEFPLNSDWINLKNPISMQDLKGKIVLLYFWKFTSIHSIQAIEEIKKLERKWKKELIPIGIHTPKFPAEMNQMNVQQATFKLEIDHPVLNDTHFFLSGQYNVSSWPYLVLIDPKGKIFGVQIGEGFQEGLDSILKGMVDEFREAKLINPNPIDKIQLIKNKPNTLLSFPTKLALNKNGTELFVSNSNRNQVLRIDLKTNRILEKIGSGERGFKDENFYAANFNYPQGLAIDDNLLYIADSKNHSIRLANLKTKKVTTLAGIGELARSINVTGKGVALSSPSDLVLHKNKLLITMQGVHQIWILDLLSTEIDIYAGRGNENLFDGKFSEASFAQPISLTKDDVNYYILDAETSSVRTINYKKEGKVKTLLGRGLLEFGDSNGSLETAKLQYPMGIYCSNGILFIADTLNQKIKQIDLRKNEISTLAGNGKIGADNGYLPESKFYNPEGIAVFQNKVYVADTNNHLIRIIHLDTNLVSNLEIE